MCAPSSFLFHYNSRITRMSFWCYWTCLVNVKQTLKIPTIISIWTCKSCLCHKYKNLWFEFLCSGCKCVIRFDSKWIRKKTDHFCRECNGTMNKWSMMLFTVICSYVLNGHVRLFSLLVVVTALPRIEIIGHEFVSLSQIIIKIKATENKNNII